MSTEDLLHAFETHDLSAIERLLAGGLDPNTPINGRAPLETLIEFYMRSNALPACVTALIDAGARVQDLYLIALIRDDEAALLQILAADPNALRRRFHLRCTFTSLEDVSALHVCAEYNAVRCAEALLRAGLDVNEPAAILADGTGGHTALFHTVNSRSADYPRAVRECLLDHGAATDVRVEAMAWGKGFEWATTLFDVTPLSYAQCGLLPQFHRDPGDIYSVIDDLYRRRNSRSAPIVNLPNHYLS